MKTINTIIVTLITLLIFSSCSHEKILNIKNPELLKEIGSYQTSRDCQIIIEPVIDNRPDYEINVPRNGFKLMRKVLPIFPFYMDFKIAGPILRDPKYFDTNLVTNIQPLISSVLEKSNFCSGKGKKYHLKTELEHYYEVHYRERSVTFFQIVFIIIKTKNLYPCSQISIKMTLIDDENSKEIATRYLSESYLHNINDSINIFSPYTTIFALQNLVNKIPSVVDEMLSNVSIINNLSSKQYNSFKIIRLTTEYDFLEEMIIEYESGRIIKDEIVKRTLPIFSKPDEWVVAPTSEDGHWLSSNQYKSLIEQLKMKYDIEYANNINAANFYGIKK